MRKTGQWACRGCQGQFQSSVATGVMRADRRGGLRIIVALVVALLVIGLVVGFLAWFGAGMGRAL